VCGRWIKFTGTAGRWEPGQGTRLFWVFWDVESQGGGKWGAKGKHCRSGDQEGSFLGGYNQEGRQRIDSKIAVPAPGDALSWKNSLMAKGPGDLKGKRRIGKETVKSRPRHRGRGGSEVRTFLRRTQIPAPNDRTCYAQTVKAA